MNKLIKIIMVIMMITLLPIKVYADSTVYTEGTLNYTLEDGSITITGYFGKDATVEIPSQIAGNPVNTIAAGAFTNNTYVKKIIIPDTITTIEDGAIGSSITVTQKADDTNSGDNQESGEGGGSVPSGGGGTTPTVTKKIPSVTAPTAKTLTYTGKAQQLINAGSTTGGTLQYKLNNGSWSASIPTATNVGKYTVYYRVKGNDQYLDVEEKSITVEIKEAKVKYKQGWNLVDNKWYLADKDGNLLTGWQKVNNTWYYLDKTTGIMKTGWLKDNNVWYYLSTSGSMKTGWIKDNNTWYYLNSNGSMKTGWIKLNNTWYYLNTNGSMKTGWLKYKNSWYYLNTNGSMASNTWINNYHVNNDGIWDKTK